VEIDVASVEHVLTTTRTVRKRLDFDRPVERAVVERCLEVAFQAPNGSNAQNWAWVVVGDAETKARMGDLYRAGLRHTAAPGREKPYSASGFVLYGGRRGAYGGSEGTAYLADNLERAPLLLVPCLHTRHRGGGTFEQASHWGSILPAAWSFMLALRAHGLVSAWTTVHLYEEEAMAELLGIPPGYVQAGLFPIAHPIGDAFHPADRSASAGTVHWDRWSP
jgi:nitroreductase